MHTLDLQIGDVLLYTGSSLIDRAIQLKTWSRFSHVEVYVGQGFSVASRNGIGVGRYPLRKNDLAAILRPNLSFDSVAALDWFKTVEGEPYGWINLLVFFNWKKAYNDKELVCSPFATKFMLAGGLQCIATHYDAGEVAPGQFMMMPTFTLMRGLL